MTFADTARGIVDTARISVGTLADAALGRLDSKASDERLAWWSNKLLDDIDAKVEVRGGENLPKTNDTCIVMSNHQSLYDIPVLYRAIPQRLRMVAKAELFRVPVWGRAMRAAGFVEVDRKNPKQAVASLRKGGAMLGEGTLLWLAPEGTRSSTGIVGPFKSGGFHLALETGQRILPVAIDGTRDILPTHSLTVQRDKRVIVTILPPIDPSTYGHERRKELMRDVREVIISAIGR